MEYGAKTDIIAQTARLAGRLLLENGAETYRVEDTVSYICKSFGLTEVSVLSLPTGTVYSFVDADGVPHCEVIRIKVRTTNLGQVARVNEISRGIVTGAIPLAEGYERLDALSRAKPQPLWLAILASAVSAAFFSLLFGGNAFDFLIALLCGAVTRALAVLFSEDSVSSTLYTLLSGALSAAIAVFSVRLYPLGNQTSIIIGAIMPLLPGLAITNAIRDTVNGDLVSGVARTADALLKAVAIAAGVGAAPVAAFVAGVLVGISAEITARLRKGPAIVYATMGVIPLVPGYGLYRTMEYMVQTDYMQALAAGMETALVAGAIALSLGFSTVVARNAFRLLGLRHHRD